ncbi:MAG: cyclic nucleotide-binding domain-containing protein, partial [Kineothrix sp.]|nr:cyclic nucleotide-binding domain-containing protein [Kineothrix sp.]
TGEFRWEMCRRIQGPRWNVPSEPSLTSEYFDYIQFYKKNHELTADAKEKIKSAMQKAKNSYKEMFINDYITWILFEGAGSPRLNKVARTIISTYCPFSKEIRDRLGGNPMYKEILEKYELKNSQKLHHMEALCQKIERSQIPLPEELLIQKKYLES